MQPNQDENSPFNFVWRHIGWGYSETVFRAIAASKSRSCRFQIYHSVHRLDLGVKAKDENFYS